MKLYSFIALWRHPLVAGIVIWTLGTCLPLQSNQADQIRGWQSNPAPLFLFRIKMMKSVLEKSGTKVHPFTKADRWHTRLTQLEQTIRQAELNQRYPVSPDFAKAERLIDKALTHQHSRLAHEQHFSQSIQSVTRLTLNYVEGYLQEHYCPGQASRMIDKGQALGAIPGLADWVLGAQNELSQPTIKKLPVTISNTEAPTDASGDDTSSQPSLSIPENFEPLIRELQSDQIKLNAQEERINILSSDLRSKQSELSQQKELTTTLLTLRQEKERMHQQISNQKQILETASVGLVAEQDRLKQLEQQLLSEDFDTPLPQQDDLPDSPLLLDSPEPQENPFQRDQFIANLKRIKLEEQQSSIHQQRHEALSELRKIEDRQKRLQSHHQNVRQALDRWALKKSSIEEILDQKNKKLNGLQLELDKHRQTLATGLHQQEARAREIEDLNTALLEDQTADLSARVKALQETLKDKQEEFSAIKQQKELWTREIEELGQSDKVTAEDLEALHQMTLNHEKTFIKPLQDNVKQAEHELRQEKDRLKKAQTSLDEVNLEHNKITAEIKGSQSLVRQLEQKLKPHTVEIKETEASLLAHEELHDDLIQNLNRAQSELDQTSKDNTRHTLDRQLSELNRLLDRISVDEQSSDPPLDTEVFNSDLPKNSNPTLEAYILEQRELLEKRQHSYNQALEEQHTVEKNALHLDQELNELFFEHKQTALESDDLLGEKKPVEISENDYQQRLQTFSAQEQRLNQQVETLAGDLEQLNIHQEVLVRDRNNHWEALNRLANEHETPRQEPRSPEMSDTDWGAGFSRWVVGNSAWIAPANKVLVRGMIAWYTASSAYYGLLSWYEGSQENYSKTQAEEALTAALSDDNLALYGTTPAPQPKPAVNSVDSLRVNQTSEEAPVCLAPQTPPNDKHNFHEFILKRPPVSEVKPVTPPPINTNDTCPATEIKPETPQKMDQQSLPVTLNNPDKVNSKRTDGFTEKFDFKKYADSFRKPAFSKPVAPPPVKHTKLERPEASDGFSQKFDYKVYADSFRPPECPAPASINTETVSNTTQLHPASVSQPEDVQGFTKKFDFKAYADSFRQPTSPVLPDSEADENQQLEPAKAQEESLNSEHESDPELSEPEENPEELPEQNEEQAPENDPEPAPDEPQSEEPQVAPTFDHQALHQQSMRDRSHSIQSMNSVTGLFTLSFMSGVWDSCHAIWNQHASEEPLAPEFTHLSGFSYGDMTLASNDQTGQWYTFLQGHSQSGSHESTHWQGSTFSWGTLGFINDNWLAGLMVSRQRVSINLDVKGDSVKTEATQFSLLSSFQHSAWRHNLMLGLGWPEYRVKSPITGEDDFQTLQWQGYASTGYQIKPGWFSDTFSIEPRIEILKIWNKPTQHSLNIDQDSSASNLKSNSGAEVYQLGVQLELLLPGISQQQQWLLYAGRQHVRGSAELSYELVESSTLAETHNKISSKEQVDYTILAASFRHELSNVLSISFKINGQWSHAGSNSGLNLNFTRSF
ncbi:autotransporter domain-containing protein [Endozoicomonas numazuensis]|uniref:Autotransporter domain-containing protein n=1 Tax=Endozoicomonas numazuensis TaxID=1137799 RepID=A0A081NIE7_9GAMM|nr:autotransporter domain-containing protein [Endozoicomonas numazuensis]KEQ18220.1 hypothetical protein GZ78_11850 [Endozoicomonas numazuensis]